MGQCCGMAREFAIVRWQLRRAMERRKDKATRHIAHRLWLRGVLQADRPELHKTAGDANPPTRRNTLSRRCIAQKMRLSGLEPETYGLKVRCSTD